MTNCYTADEVKSHNIPSDCWVIYKEKVYDVTPFLEDVQIRIYEVNFVLISSFSILEVKKLSWNMQVFIKLHVINVFTFLGMDCTVAFEDVGHSESAYDMLKDFYIGDFVESKVNCADKCCGDMKSSSSNTCKPSSCQ